MQEKLDAALNILRRLPPNAIESNLQLLVRNFPELAEDLLVSVDRPLEKRICPTTKRPYLICEYNRDDNSYRSPWSNLYDPPLSDGTVPSPSLRKLEEAANTAFSVYLDLYYEGGLSSVYMWDTDEGFACVILIQKIVASDDGTRDESWNSIHVFGVNEGPNQMAHYKLTSTVLLSITNQANGQLDLTGSISRQQIQDASAESHLVNLGQMLEDMESKLRDHLKNIYFDKTRDVLNELRSLIDLSEVKKQEEVQTELVAKLATRKSTPFLQ